MKNFLFYYLFPFVVGIVVLTVEPSPEFDIILPYIYIAILGIIGVVSVYRLISKYICSFKSNSKKYKLPYNPKDLV